MNREQLQALIWLRYRISVNRARRAGIASAVVLGLLMALGVLLAIGLLFIGFMLGRYGLANATATTLLLSWDGVVGLFLIVWLTTLLADLQRADSLSLDKLLHLPVSPAGAFAINYLGSLCSPTLLIAGSGLAGLSLGLLAGRGLTMLWLLPLVALFLLLVTAVTHQFQGWLASLMANKRRRRMILVMVSLTIALASQMPNLAFQFWAHKSTGEIQQRYGQLQKEYDQLNDAFQRGEITLDEFQQRWEAINQQYEQTNADQWVPPELQQHAWLANLLLPPGWLPLGVMAAAEGHPLPAALCCLGMGLLAAASLWRSYRTTLAMYLGQFSADGRRVQSGASPPARSAPRPTAQRATSTANWTERYLGWLPPEAAIVAATTLRALVRAPEVRMLLLSPLFMVVIMAPAMWNSHILESTRPIATFGALMFFLVTLGQLVSNQFGFDRCGFQALVLSGARRRDILLGKNLAVAPFMLGFGIPLIVVVQYLWPLPLRDFLAVPLQFVSNYLLFCLVANWASILGPTAVPTATFRRPKPSGMAIAVQLASMFLLFPLVMAAAWVPLGAQMVANLFKATAGWPVALLLSLLECVVVIYVYLLALDWLGGLLQQREQDILVTVKTPAE